MSQPIVFISYSHKDEAEKDKLLSHLSVLQGAGLIDSWSDDRIGVGKDWEEEINQAMVQAKVAILLISTNFLTSDFILRKEVPTLLKRRESEGLTVFPVIAKPCAWRKIEWLSEMNVRPKNGRPVWSDEGKHADDDLATIAEEVAEIVKKVDYGPGPISHPGDTSPQRVPFTNREDEIRLVLSSFAPAYYLLNAPAGYGKTELLKELERRFKEQNWRCAYISIEEQDTIANLVTGLALKLEVTPVQDTELPWGWRLGGALQGQWNNAPKEGLVLLIDLEKRPALPIVKELLGEFIPAVQGSLRTLEFFEKNHNRCRVILAGRHLAAASKATSLPLKILHLATFDYSVIRDSAREYLDSHSEESVIQLAAHLVYLTGGHPGCIAKTLEMYKEKGLTPDDFFAFYDKKVWREIVRGVIDDIHSGIPEDFKGFDKIIDRLSVFRYLDYAVLGHIIEEDEISEVSNEYNLADKLTATYLFTRKGRFLRDAITRRLLAIWLRHRMPEEEFSTRCQKARKLCVDRMQDPKVQRREIWAIEYLFQSLQQHANIVQNKSRRRAIRDEFFGDVSKALQMLVNDMPPEDRQEEQYALDQAMEEDWEFRFTVNYYLREDQYNDEPYNELQRRITYFFTQEQEI